jgi:hypothetical protein
MSAERKSRLLAVFTVAVLALCVMACGSAKMTEQEWNPTDPFSSRMEGGEGTAVEWNGYAQGHRSGEESMFELTLHNGSQETWSGLYCMQLLDRDGVAATLTQAGFSLQPGESWSRQEPIRFPDGLAEGAYGLATIQVGGENKAYSGPWPEPVCP